MKKHADVKRGSADVASHPPKGGAVSAVKIDNLTVSYERHPVLRAITLDIAQRQIVGIIGPNGAGKSTLLKAIMGLLRPDTGTVAVFGADAVKARERIAYVPQRSTVDWDFPVTVHDVVLMGRYGKLGYIRRPGAEDKRIVEESLRRLEMLPFRDRQIGELSGGQQQRVFLARALAQECDLLILDEPFVGVDAATEQSILRLLASLKADGKTILVVNHDLSDVTKTYDSVALINRRLIAYGPAEKVFTNDLLGETYGGRLTLLERAEQEAR